MYNSNFVNLPRTSGVSVRTGPGYGNKNVDTEQIRRPLPPHDGSWYLIECNCGNCFLVAVHKKPVPGCNQCRHINIITGVSGEVSGYQCLGVFRSWPGGGGRCSLRLQRDEWCSHGWGENSAAVYGVSRGGSYVSFVPSLFTVDFITNVQTWAGVSFECHLTLVPASPPLILEICFASSPIIRHDTGQLQESGATAELQNFTDIPAHSVQSWVLVHALGRETS